MKILMLTEYFYPFDRGGSEWSTYHLSKGLQAKNHSIGIVTPNYGCKEREIWKGLSIYRFWFPKRLPKHKGRAISPFWHTNVLWFLTSLYGIWRAIKDEKPSIIHVQGKYFLPAAILLGKMYDLRIVTTLRDYQVLCPYGLCITKERGYKKCSYIYFVQKELKEYLSRYHVKATRIWKIFLSLAGIRARIVSSLLSFFSAKSDILVTISQKMNHICYINALPSQTIYNPMSINKIRRKKKNIIVFAGRLTWGKGADMVIPSVANFLSRYKITLVIFGDGNLGIYMKNQARAFHVTNYVVFQGHSPYDTVINSLETAKLAIVPSVWEEPFGRVALEAIMCGTPVVASNRGGLPEIVENGKTGYTVDPIISSFRQAVKMVIKKEDIFRKNINNNRSKLEKKFFEDPIEFYNTLYQQIIAP